MNPQRPRHGPAWQPRSLRVRLLAFLLAAIALTALLQGVLAYRSALAEADALSDYHMQQTAFALRAGLPLGVAGLGTPSAARAQPENHDFIVQVWTNEGLRIFESAVGAALPQLAVLGFANVPAHGTTYRVFSLQTPAQVIQVAQDMAVRRAMARALALRSLLPLALMAPLLALAVWWTVTRQLAPVQRVRAQLAQRQADDLSPVSDAQLPDEVRPVVAELNLLFARVRTAFEAQQHFVADAAHELRSPLAALKLQLQGLRRAPDDAARQRCAERLDAGIDRAARLVEQLLLLARQEASAAASPPPQPVALADVARLALADVAAAAQARGIDLGLTLQADEFHLVVQGHADAIRILVRNLLDNAVKYTPEGGTVDLALGRAGGAVQLCVQDSGPGIAPAERERVLGRFYRTRDAAQDAQGSGLGLAIVQAIARWHGAVLELGASAQWGGLRVVVAFAPDAAAKA
jgi:two-component system OmpR family sensor kinase